MTNWTPAARQELEQYFARLGPWLKATCPALTIERLKPEVQAARGQLSEPGLISPDSQVRLRRDPNARFAWTTDERTLGTDIVTQRLVETNLPPTKHLVLAFDTSAAMQADWDRLIEPLRALPPETELRVVLAGDEPVELGRNERSQQPLDRDALLARLHDVRLTGGQDNLPALVRAWDLAAAAPDGVVVWVHAPQPVVLGDPAPLRQRYQRRPHGPRILTLQTRPGPNQLLEKLDRLAGLTAAPRLDGAAEDLTALLARLTGRANFVAARRERVPADARTFAEATRTAPHLARLWARDVVAERRAARNLAGAKALAGKFQLVTLVSGAVVLENQAQFQAAGLHPVDPQTVPAIPEPGTRTLLLLGAAFLLLAKRRHRPSSKS